MHCATLITEIIEIITLVRSVQWLGFPHDQGDQKLFFILKKSIIYGKSNANFKEEILI